MKLRKMLAAAAALVLTLSMGMSAFADGIDLSGVDAAQKNTGSSVSSDDLKKEDAQKGIFDLGSTDVVTCSNGEYTIATDLLTVSVYPPFGWLCLTQDLGQQLDLYIMLFGEPTAVVQSMIQDNTHLVLFDSSWGYSCEVRIIQDTISSLIGNSSALSASDEAAIIDFIKNSCFSDCTEASAQTYGSNRFYKFVFNGGATVLYETYVNSVCVDFFLYGDGSSEIDSDICSDIEYMLADFTAS